ncbi:hypothetical protein [Candidatus Nitronereus thalassa]|uniref:Uncharacterized protein n=1 Tax=Candidatus Nitronereus thalassa TaxID=3020898 RepID=A0ABU3K501_9BACT|nr:hypothetical protein [Candidatus Nitronereus thalassa]MDT7041435.1 hypothetical protein [Candidatus Nitronereus thalassa]
MPIATMAFRRCVVNSPSYGSDEEHVITRIFFDLQVRDAAYANLCVDVRQLVREGAETEPLLVSRPEGYEGPLNIPVFQGLVEFYYRQAVGEKWGMFGNTGIRMRLEDWVIEYEMLVQFEVSDEENSLEVGT